jgi:alpha-L-rhamnosidase
LSSRREFIRDAGLVVGIAAAAPGSVRAEAREIAGKGTDAPAGAWVPNAEQSTAWVAKAEALKPTLVEVNEPALRLVRPVADASVYLRWRMETEASAEALRDKTFRAGDSFMLDFGGHRAGCLSFLLEGAGRSVDAPARLKLTFGEVPGTVAEPLHPYHGDLREAWLPEEIITVDFLPQRVRMPRRYAFRYVKVDVIATSPSYAARFSDFTAHGVSSATASVAPLAATVPDKLRRIDAVSLKTLHDCMQTVFEDGVKRDQRLWIGDMRVQALTKYATYRNYALPRRCLYLLAVFPREALRCVD